MSFLELNSGLSHNFDDSRPNGTKSNNPFISQRNFGFILASVGGHFLGSEANTADHVMNYRTFGGNINTGINNKPVGVDAGAYLCQGSYDKKIKLSNTGLHVSFRRSYYIYGFEY